VHSENNPAIIGGEDVTAPDKIQTSIVAVYDNQSQNLCTGALLGNNLVLTAAHCLAANANTLQIYFGRDLNATGFDPSMLRDVDKMMASPYNERRGFGKYSFGDIALVHFQGSVPSGYKNAVFMGDKAALQKGIAVVVAGYGFSNGVENSGMGILRKTTLTILDPSYRPADADANDTFPASEILVDQSQGRGTCHGDSGGPAFIMNRNRWYLWGVISRGIGPGLKDCTGQALITNALIYKSWIMKTAKKMTASSGNVLTQ
jgi:secreted trypsin-like serine protease